jgi:hypothetical protein
LKHGRPPEPGDLLIIKRVLIEKLFRSHHENMAMARRKVLSEQIW